MSKSLTPDQVQIVKGALAEYGATISDEQQIVRNDKTLGVRVTTERGRLQFRNAATGRAVCSGPMTGESVRRFVKSFWYW